MNKIIAALIGSLSLSGCAAAAIATTVGVSAVGSKGSSELPEYGHQVSRMNCSQLQAEYKKQKSKSTGVTQIDGLRGVASRRAIVVDAITKRGCTLPS